MIREMVKHMGIVTGETFILVVCYQVILFRKQFLNGMDPDITYNFMTEKCLYIQI